MVSIAFAIKIIKTAEKCCNINEGTDLFGL